MRSVMDRMEKKEDASETKVKFNVVIDKQQTSTDSSETEKVKEEPKYFQCFTCILRERYDYFGSNPPQVKNYILLEDAYVIEDPFTAPKQGKIIILGSHCIVCRKPVCKDANCSIYFDGSYCIKCAKSKMNSFPLTVQEKLNKIV